MELPGFTFLHRYRKGSHFADIVAESTGRQARDIKSQADELGDLGLVAEKSRSTQRTLGFGTGASGGALTMATAGGGKVGGKGQHTLRSIYEAFRAIAAEVEGRRPPKDLDFPTIDDGVEGMAFIATVVRSSQRGAKWLKFPPA